MVGGKREREKIWPPLWPCLLTLASGGRGNRSEPNGSPQMFPFSSSPFIHTSCKGGFLKVQRKKKLLEPEALGGSCGFDQRLEQWIAQADGDRDWNQSLTIEENGWPLLFVQSWKTRSATSFSFPSCCCCLRGSCFFSSFLYRLSHCVLARRIGPAAIVQLNVYSFIIFFSFCRWWRCCFRRPRGSVVLFGGRRIAGPTVMPGSASMAYKMSSRPMGPIGGVGERRAMGDSSHYEEIALIGNGKSNTLFIFYYYYLLDRAEFIRWYLCVDRSIITHGFEYLLRFHNFCVEKCWKNQIEANR